MTALRPKHLKYYVLILTFGDANYKLLFYLKGPVYNI